MACDPPPKVSNAKYTSLKSYPPGSKVEYECINSRYINKGTNNTKLVCGTLDNGETQWKGDRIECQLQSEVNRDNAGEVTHNLIHLSF